MEEQSKDSSASSTVMGIQKNLMIKISEYRLGGIVVYISNPLNSKTPNTQVMPSKARKILPPSFRQQDIKYT